MKKIELKYGCNPNQKPASVYMEDGSELPFEVLNGKPGYINLLDALNGWQLVSEIKEATGKAAAASFKHVSPSSAAVGRVMSDNCDETCAKLIKREVSDGVIAPEFTDAALEVLKQKKNGNYLILKVNEKFRAPEVETKQVFGVTFEQKHNDIKIDKTCLNDVVTEIKDIPEDAKDDLVIALITLKYTQSNSVVYAADGQTIGVGAGQQSRVHCTRLAGSKPDNWHLRQSEKVLNLPFKEGTKRPNKDNFIDRYIAIEDTPEARGDFDWKELFSEKPEVFTFEEKRQILDAITGVSVASDAFFPFSDNIDRAHESGVSYIAQPGGSTRDDLVIDSCNKYGIAMAFTGFRLFHH